jgi:hypothetical protein
VKRDLIVRAVFDTIVICVVAAVIRQYHVLPRALVAGLQTLLLGAVVLRSIAKWYGLGPSVLLHGDRGSQGNPGEVSGSWRVLRRARPALQDGVRADRPGP